MPTITTTRNVFLSPKKTHTKKRSRQKRFVVRAIHSQTQAASGVVAVQTREQENTRNKSPPLVLCWALILSALFLPKKPKETQDVRAAKRQTIAKRQRKEGPRKLFKSESLGGFTKIGTVLGFFTFKVDERESVGVDSRLPTGSSEVDCGSWSSRRLFEALQTNTKKGKIQTINQTLSQHLEIRTFSRTTCFWDRRRRPHAAYIKINRPRKDF
jgi:hypothetical protein